MNLARMTEVAAAVGAAMALSIWVGPADATADVKVDCYGDYCSGESPNASGCAQDAKTLVSEPLSGAMLEVRYSPTCKTNWAKYTQYPVGFKTDQPVVLRAVQDTGYQQTYEFGIDGAKEGVYTTNMIYSPVHKVHAEVVVQCGDMSLIGTAFDCAMNGLVQTPAV